MASQTFRLSWAAAALISTTGVEAQPLEATYTGVLWGTQDAFTATFHYDTKDLVPSPGNSSYLDAKSGTVQWATYVDPFRSFTFNNPTSFSKGEYDSIVYDASGDGSISEIDTVHDYAISVSSGYLSLTFGGVGDTGLVTFGADGLDYANLDPKSFLLTKDLAPAVSPVPLPPGAPLFAGALLLVGLVGRATLRSAASLRA